MDIIIWTGLAAIATIIAVTTLVIRRRVGTSGEAAATDPDYLNAGLGTEQDE